MPLLQQLRHGSSTVTQLMTQQAKAVVVCSMHEEGQVTCDFPYHMPAAEAAHWGLHCMQQTPGSVLVAQTPRQ
jgi:hypothetical protein